MRVSIVIPVFNSATTVSAAIESALGQNFSGAREVIAVNDGSTDASARVLASFGERIKTITQANRGLAAARNAGTAAAAASSEYLAFLDADDVWLPDKLASAVAPLDQNRLAALSYSDVLPVNDAGETVSRNYIKPRHAHAPSMAEMLREWWPILPSTVVMRRALFERCGRFCEEFPGADGHEDVDCWLRARELGEFVYVDRCLVRYRVNPESNVIRYERNFAIFTRLVRERYGMRSWPLLRAMRLAYVTAYGHRGRIAMRDGDIAEARRAFIRALSYRPLHLRTALRLARTFLPRSLARALSSESRRHSGRTA